MRVKRFFGVDSRQAMRQVHEELGENAVILSNKKVPQGVEIVCALDYSENTDPASFAEALKESDKGTALQRELDEARQRILSGAKFDTNLGENSFQRKARINQLGDWEANTANPASLINKIKEERKRVARLLQKTTCVTKIYPSDANFILIKVTDANAIYNYLVEKGIIIRNRHSVVLCEDCLRITIGTPDENTQLLNFLQLYK